MSETNTLIITTNGKSTSQTVTTVGLSDRASVSKAGPNIGYPQFLGQRNMSSTLHGEKLVTYLGGHSYQYEKELINGTIIEAEASGQFPLPMGAIKINHIDDDLEFWRQTNTKLLSNIYSAQAEWQGGVFLGELASTIRLFKSPLKGFVTFTDRLLMASKHFRRKYGPPSKWTKFTLQKWSDQYLTYCYGVAPLIGDMENLKNRVNDILDSKETKIVKASLSDNDVVYVLEDSPCGMHNLRYDVTVVQTITRKGMGKASIRALPMGPRFVPGNLGMRLADFVPTLWQLFPYGFIADYFLDIEAVVNASFAELHSCTWHWVGSRVEIKHDLIYSNQSFVTDPDSADAQLPAGVIEHSIVRRHPANGIDVVPQPLSLPGFSSLAGLCALIVNKASHIR